MNKIIRMPISLSIITLIYIVVVSFNLRSDEIINTTNYTLEQPASIKWEPSPGKYNNTVGLNLSSDEGTVFFLINSTLHEREPTLFNKTVFLTADEGAIRVFTVTAILERRNGKVETHTAKYTIDRTRTFYNTPISTKDTISRVKTSANGQSVYRYSFSSNIYRVETNERKFVFPSYDSLNQSGSDQAVIDEISGDKRVFAVALSYKKNNEVITLYKPELVDLKKPVSPSMGTLFWGQVYHRDYKIHIVPENNNDKTYFWLREWKKDEIITGPPQTNDIERWNEFEGPIQINPLYGEQGTIGVASFTRGKNGVDSDITGPYYFKVTDSENDLKQKFTLKRQLKKKPSILINDVIGELPFDNGPRSYRDKVTVTFKDHEEGESFYFEFVGEGTKGLSERFPCEGTYTFEMSDIYPVFFTLYYSDGNKIGSINLKSRNHLYPIPKKHRGTTIVVSGDKLLEFHMPDSVVKYEVSDNLFKYIDINSNSPEFKGVVLANGEDGHETIYKIKFGSFDQDDNKFAESPDYEIRIDKKKPESDIVLDGVNLNIVHNDKLKMTLIQPESDSKVFYKLFADDDWIRYTEPVTIYPQTSYKHTIIMYAKSVDYSGNERVNAEPFVIRFDRRGVFVDTAKKTSGNGTEDSPYNSIERAVYFAEQKGLKNIWIMSKENTLTNPLKINSDIVIQPYNLERASINLLTRALSDKNYTWLNFGEKGYAEFRNISFSVNSGNSFAVLNGNKVKFYFSDFDIKGSGNFDFIKGVKSGVALIDVALRSDAPILNLSMISLDGGTFVSENLSVNLIVNKLRLFDIKNTTYSSLDSAEIDVKTKSDTLFASFRDSKISLNRVIYNQSGTYRMAGFAELYNTELSISNMDMIITGERAFNMNILDDKESRVTIEGSLFRVENGFSITGFNSTNGKMKFIRSMLDINKATDQITGFRLNRTDIDISSSVIRLDGGYNNISFSLRDSIFNGTNNSLFSVNGKGKSYSFWINDSAKFNSINSIYYFDNMKLNNDTLVFFNNPFYDRFKPLWLSNIVSSSASLLENLDKKDDPVTVKDFNENNLLYQFEKDFNMADSSFFVPLLDSPIFQGGLSQYASPIPLSESDFLNKQRVIEGIGVDIGAIQLSGHDVE